ncbi:hypothetical protein KFU94_47925 [Chloroflexi bacterium TSY]|nr:hypothetical protein [Chloroflexi bacterium TSY]
MQILSPTDGSTVAPSFLLKVDTNWPVEPNGRHFHWFLDGADQGAVYTVNPLTVENVAEGNHAITVKLAEADHTFIGVKPASSLPFKRRVQRQPTVTHIPIGRTDGLNH